MGFIYEIEEDKNAIGLMKESDYYPAAGILAEYFSTESMEAVEALLEGLHEFGIEIGYEDGIPYFALSSETRKNYFKKRYEEVKKIVAEMSLDTFATSSCTSLLVMIDDCYDAVHDGTLDPISFDQWLREAKTDVRYYVGNVVFSH